jgi:hypothetical protein
MVAEYKYKLAHDTGDKPRGITSPPFQGLKHQIQWCKEVSGCNVSGTGCNLKRDSKRLEIEAMHKIQEDRTIIR